MSDQPHWDPNLERQIPGLREAVSNLSSVASGAGFRVTTIVLAPDQPQNPSPPIRIAFAPPTRQPVFPPVTPPPGMPSTPIHPLPQHFLRGPHPLGTGQGISFSRHGVQQGSKRSSTPLAEDEGKASPSAGKRTRLSDPSRAGAFWGTVLEERPGSPQGMFPSRGRPGLSPNLPTPHPHIRLIPGKIQSKWRNDAEKDTESEDRVHRSTTFPALRTGSPRAHEPQQGLPSLQEPLLATHGQIFRDRLASGSSRPHRQMSERPIFRSATRFFGQFSPFGAPAESASRGSFSSAPLAGEDPFLGGTSTGLPAFHGKSQRAASELFSHPKAADILHARLFPPMRSVQDQQSPYAMRYGTAGPQQSVSMSASGSGVQRGEPSQKAYASSSGARRGQIGSRPHERRGRQGGAPSEREYLFECDQCTAKFRRKSDKNRHVRVVHDKSRPFVCPICEKTFGEKSNMLKHRASVHDEVRTFRCPYCDASFPQRGLCDTHVKTIHQKKQAKYFCEHCGLPFSRKIHLNEHIEQAHPQFGPYLVGGSSTTPAHGGRISGSGSAEVEDRSLVGDTTRQLTWAEAPRTFGTFGNVGPVEGATAPQASVPHPAQGLSPTRHSSQAERWAGSKQPFHRDNAG